LIIIPINHVFIAPSVKINY